MVPRLHVSFYSLLTSHIRESAEYFKGFSRRMDLEEKLHDSRKRLRIMDSGTLSHVLLLTFSNTT